MSAMLLTYTSQRETSLKEQEKATQPSVSVGVRHGLLHSCDVESEFGGGGRNMTEIMLGELGLLCPDALFHTRKEKSGGEVLLVSEAKPRFICGDSRADWEKFPRFNSNRRHLRHHLASLLYPPDASLMCRGGETSATACTHSLWCRAPPNYQREIRNRDEVDVLQTRHKVSAVAGRLHPTPDGGVPLVSFHHCSNILQQIR